MTRKFNFKILRQGGYNDWTLRSRPIFQILRGIKGAYNVALMKAIPKKDTDNNYLYYFLNQKSLFEYVNALSPRTGGQTGVDVFMLKKYPINFSELSIQKQIAKVLSDLDAKIEVNNQINQQLEAMAKTLYDYWFVQFDFPVSLCQPELVEGDVNGTENKNHFDKLSVDTCQRLQILRRYNGL